MERRRQIQQQQQQQLAAPDRHASLPGNEIHMLDTGVGRLVPVQLRRVQTIHAYRYGLQSMSASVLRKLLRIRGFNAEQADRHIGSRAAKL